MSMVGGADAPIRISFKDGTGPIGRLVVGAPFVYDRSLRDVPSGGLEEDNDVKDDVLTRRVAEYDGPWPRRV